MKRTLTSIAAASMVLGLTVPAAFAATSHTNYNQRTISIGSYSAGLKGIAAKDPWSGANTEFMPIFYLQQGLKALGYTATWNGTTHTLAITTSSGSTTGLTKVTPGNGTVITVNGVPIVNAPKALVAKDPASGKWTSYLPIYYLADALKALGYTSSYNGAAGTWTVKSAVKLAVTGAPSSDVAVGQQVALGVTNNGTAVTSGVTWSASGGVIDQMGNFVASAAGTYTITASYGGQTATATVTVYGQPASVKLSAQSGNLVADNTATDTITATVVDANGNTVSNYNGMVEIPPVASITYTDTNGNNLPVAANGNYEVTVTNGVGQFDVTAATTLQGTTGTIASMDLSNVGTSSINYGTVSLSYVAPAATSIGLTAASAYLSDNSGSNSDVITATINNQSGDPMASGAASQYVTFTINGNGSFAQGSTLKTLSEYVTPNGLTGTPITVYAIQGQGGPVTVTATATGLTQGTVTLNATVTTAPASVTLSGKPETTSTGTPYTLYTAQLVDANGVPVAPTSTDNLTISDNTSTVGGTLQYYPVSNGIPNFTTAYTASTLPSADFATAANGGTGVFQFAVQNSSVGTGAATITVADALTTKSATATYAFQTGSPAYALLPGDTTAALTQGTYNAQAGQTANFKINLTDASGNALTTSGQSVDVYIAGTNAGDATINGSNSWTAGNPFVATSVNGVVTVPVAVASTAASGDTFTVNAQVAGQTHVSQLTAKVVSAQGYTTQLGLGSAANAPDMSYSLPTSMNAGDTLISDVATTPPASLFVVPLNAVGAYSGNADNITITTSNSNVLQIGNGSTSSVTQSSSAALPTITAMNAGTATLTITDNSNNAAPVLKTTITVAAGSASELQAVNPDGTLNTSYTFTTSGVVGPFTIETTDGGGNLAPVTSPVGLTASQVEAILGVSGVNGIRTSASGSDVSTVTIPQGQASFQVWVDGATANASTTPTAPMLNTEGPALTGVSGSGSTVNLTFDGAITNPTTGNITLSGGQTISSSSINGSTLTLNLGSPVSVGETVSLAAGAVQSGYGAASLATTSAQTISGAPASTGVVASGATQTAGVAGTPGTAATGTLTVTTVPSAADTLTVTVGTVSKTVTLTSSNDGTAAGVASAIAAAFSGDATYTATVNSTTPSEVDFAQITPANGTITPSLTDTTTPGATAATGAAGTAGVAGTPGTAGVYDVTVSSGASASGSLSVVVKSGSTTVATVSVPVTAGQSAAQVATAIYNALNSNGSVGTDFTVTNPSSGVVELTQKTASSNTTSVSVTG